MIFGIMNEIMHLVWISFIIEKQPGSVQILHIGETW